MKARFFSLLTACLLGVASLSSHAQDGLSPAAIVKEYNDTRSKRISGYFGKAGGEVVKVHEKNIANHLATKVKAKECQDIQKYIPSLDTGNYTFAVDKEAKIRNNVSSPLDSISDTDELLKYLLSLVDQLELTLDKPEIPTLVVKRCVSFGALVPIVSM